MLIPKNRKGKYDLAMAASYRVNMNTLAIFGANAMVEFSPQASMTEVVTGLQGLGISANAFDGKAYDKLANLPSDAVLSEQL